MNKQITLIATLLTVNLSFAQPDLIFKNGMELAKTYLNDTGITWAGDYPSGNNLTCTGNITPPQDCHQGADFTNNDDSDGYAGFSFTKLDANGDELLASASNWTCVRDNITGLIWEVKTTIVDSIHHKDNTYRWGGVTALSSNYGNYYDDWNSLVNGSNAENFCGFNDWRVPTGTELKSIVDHSRINPAIDENYFPNTTNSFYWTASADAFSSSNAWFVVFNYGYSGNGIRNYNNNVRLVRKN